MLDCSVNQNCWGLDVPLLHYHQHPIFRRHFHCHLLWWYRQLESLLPLNNHLLFYAFWNCYAWVVYSTQVTYFFFTADFTLSSIFCMVVLRNCFVVPTYIWRCTSINLKNSQLILLEDLRELLDLHCFVWIELLQEVIDQENLFGMDHSIFH